MPLSVDPDVQLFSRHPMSRCIPSTPPSMPPLSHLRAGVVLPTPAQVQRAASHPEAHPDWVDGLSHWYSMAILPWEPGVYRVQLNDAWISPPPEGYALFTGHYWLRQASTPARAAKESQPAREQHYACWRGLSLAPWAVEDWPTAAARVPELNRYLHAVLADTIAEVCALMDCKPGYQLVQVVMAPTQFLYRRVDA